MKIKTNNHQRPLLTNEEGQTYFVYRGEEYFMDEFVVTDNIPGFEAAFYTSLSCVAVKLVGTNMVKVAYVYW